MDVFTPEFKTAVRQTWAAAWDATKRGAIAAYTWVRSKVTKQKETSSVRDE